MASPIVPGINDAELERILEASVEAGARGASYLFLRLPHELRPLFVEWLEAHYPSRKDKVLHRIREIRGGKLNVPVPGVSCVDLTVQLGRRVEAVEVNEVFRSAASSTMRELLDFTEQPIVSSDVDDSPRSCVFDSLATTHAVPSQRAMFAAAPPPAVVKAPPAKRSPP